MKFKCYSFGNDKNENEVGNGDGISKVIHKELWIFTIHKFQEKQIIKWFLSKKSS